MTDKAGNSSAGAPLALEKSERPSKIIKPPNRDFEVFINFRGPDTRSTVVDMFYKTLARAGFGVFYDDAVIDQGEVIAKELEEGIKKSKIYIPIFSKDYASSKWCLRELRWIIKCWEEHKEGKTILPIFHKVDVSTDLKLKPKSSYKAALREHEGKVDELELDGWEDALTTAAEIKGRDVDKVGLDDLTTLIVENVRRKIGIQSDPEKEIDDYFGMRERREEFINGYLKPKASDVRVVAIYGLAGMGKTTLARHVFKKLSSDYPGGVASISVSDVRKKFGKADTVDLQKELISQLLGVNTFDVVDTDTGVNWIKERVKIKEKVLIVLYGLDDADQVSKLAGETSWFNTGSRVIITTRNIGIIPGGEDKGFYRYKMPVLSHPDALKLLCRESFKSDSPPEGYDAEDLQEAVEMGGGIPNAICAIAAVFRHINEKLSMSNLLKNITKVRLDNYSKILMMGYEKLNKNQQAIFLDIACLFINREMNDAFYYWKVQDYFLEYEIRVLENFSFIDIVDEDKISMNRILRDRGRNIVDDENIDNPEYRSRLWSPEVAFQVVRKKKGTENVVALNLGNSNGQHDFDHEQFKGFKKLKFLELNGGNFKHEDFNYVFSELRWFSWKDCPLNFGSIKLCFQNLFILMLSKTQISENWNGWSEIQEAKGLKVLKCTDCYSLMKSPDFSAFLQLERLVFTNCPNLTEIGQSIGKLKSLSVLKLELENLTELPDSIKDLVKLMHLCLRCPKLEKLPESVGNLTKLVELDISRTKITKLPEPVMSLIRSSTFVFKHEGCGLNEEVLAGLRN